MNPKEYIEGVLKTEAPITELMIERISDPTLIRLNHAASGLITEAGEFEDTLKKHIYYGAKLDKVNLKEELGDLLWYIALACDELKTSFEEVMAVNYKKLKERYGDKFTEEAAEHRDLEKERKILEEGDKE
jgi:NTP pyrophosphatase (non-canonical NTP hydrolase)